MNGSQSSRLRPFLLDGARGALLAAYCPPVGGSQSRGDILLAPPFAEEMNRCRSMMALQARSFSRIGIGTLILDPYGTGDSAGDFVDGTWELWQDDLRRGIDWLRKQANGCRAVWGVRLGAIMAAELALRDGAIDQLLLWQPVFSGKAHFTQFLRIRVAAELEQAAGIKSTELLRRAIAAGESVEVSGYQISPALAAALDRVVMPDPAEMRSLRVDWFEVLPSADAAPPRASSKAVDEYRRAGASVELQSVVGPPFWQLHERELAPKLIERTTSSVEAWGARSWAPAGPLDTKVPPPQHQTMESPLSFSCGEDSLSGILHRGQPESTRRRGVVIVVAGGPQYRVGAHRQFVNMARKLAKHGFPVLRFDLRGMGDSSGQYLGFQHSDPDIRSAVDALLASNPHVTEAVLIGECESASGILFYAWRDPRVKGIALVNPWVRTEEGQAQVILKHYYLDRLRSPAFWRSAFDGRVDILRSLSSLYKVLRAFVRGRCMTPQSVLRSTSDDITTLPLPLKTAAGLRRYPGQVMLLMSGRDYIAREFDEVTTSSRAWDGLLDSPRICRRDLVEADHTFSRQQWKNQVSDWIVEWLGSW